MLPHCTNVRVVGSNLGVIILFVFPHIYVFGSSAKHIGSIDSKMESHTKSITGYRLVGLSISISITLTISTDRLYDADAIENALTDTKLWSPTKLIMGYRMMCLSISLSITITIYTTRLWYFCHATLYWIFAETERTNAKKFTVRSASYPVVSFYIVSGVNVCTCYGVPRAEPVLSLLFQLNWAL